MRSLRQLDQDSSNRQHAPTPERRKRLVIKAGLPHLLVRKREAVALQQIEVFNKLTTQLGVVDLQSIEHRADPHLDLLVI